jgi:hypothetical protein
VVAFHDAAGQSESLADWHRSWGHINQQRYCMWLKQYISQLTKKGIIYAANA